MFVQTRKNAFQFAERFLQLNKREVPAKWQKEVIQHDEQVSCNWKDKFPANAQKEFLQTHKRIPMVKHEWFLWMECKGSWENVCRKDTCSWAENIPAVGLKGFLQRCRKGTCFCRKNMCSWTEGIPARGRIPAQVRTGTERICKLTVRISVKVHVYLQKGHLCPEEPKVYLQTDWKDFHTKRISKEERFFVCLDYYCLKLVMTRNKPFFQMIIHQVHVFVISQ